MDLVSLPADALPLEDSRKVGYVLLNLMWMIALQHIKIELRCLPPFNPFNKGEDLRRVITRNILSSDSSPMSQ
jgi:hypothetical protein